MEASGYKAIATTSMGTAPSLGYTNCQLLVCQKSFVLLMHRIRGN